MEQHLCLHLRDLQAQQSDVLQLLLLLHAKFTFDESGIAVSFFLCFGYFTVKQEAGAYHYTVVQLCCNCTSQSHIYTCQEWHMPCHSHSAPTGMLQNDVHFGSPQNCTKVIWSTGSEIHRRNTKIILVNATQTYSLLMNICNHRKLRKWDLFLNHCAAKRVLSF